MPKRTDANQAEIVDALRKCGATVHCTHMVGSGFPDIVAGAHGRSFLLEVKVPGAKLNRRERDWHAEWRGHVAVVRTAEEALAAVGLL